MPRSKKPNSGDSKNRAGRRIPERNQSTVEAPVGETVLPKRVRRTKYESWMDDVIVDVAEQGGHVPNMCQAIGIASKDTFYRWIKEYDSFKEAYEEAKLQSQAFYEQLLLAGACGKIKNFNFSALAMILNNKFPTDYKRNATGSQTEINIGSINSIEHLNEKELDDKISRLQEKLQLVIGPKEVAPHDDEIL